MKRVLIDLTDLETWSGHHGGTQRVVYGIAKQFYLQQDTDYQVQFMAFSPRQNAFHQTSFEPIFNRTEQQVAAPSTHSAPATIPLPARLKQSLRPYVPESVRKNKHARVAAKHALRLSKGAARRAKQKLQDYRLSQSTATAGPKINFTRDDVVLILGKPWDNPTMERTLTNDKAANGFKLVQVIYDLILPLHPQLHHPSLFKNYTQYVFEAIYNSDLLWPISKSSDRDLKKFASQLNLPTPKTKVIRLADQISSPSVDNNKPDSRLADDFIACIGTVEIRKNHNLLYNTYKLADQQGIKLPQLVIVGARGWLTNDFQYLVEHDPAMKGKIIILDNLNDQGLAWVYAKCLFTVYPSFYEGWGLPVAESLANGKVCVASDSSSIPEIAGDIIDYFSPYDSQACLNLLTKYLDPKIRRRKEAQIQKEYRPTTWEDTYKQITAGLKDL